jgi:ribosomal protein L37E
MRIQTPHIPRPESRLTVTYTATRVRGTRTLEYPICERCGNDIHNRAYHRDGPLCTDCRSVTNNRPRYSKGPTQ